MVGRLLSLLGWVRRLRSGPRPSRPRTESSFERTESLRRLGEETFDVLVIGGGATGAGVALDAATRGLSVALVERHDFASGTSSLSSKMIHGGLRYLQQGDVWLVYHSLRERRRLLRNAPHLVRVLGFMLPIHTRGGLIPRAFARLFGLALWGYDAAGGWLGGKRHRRLTRDEALAHMPTLDGERIDSAYLYYDAQADDARLTLAIVRTAALDLGAVVANHLPVTALRTGEGGQVEGVVVDSEHGPVTIRAKAVVNASGVWVDDVGALDGTPGRIRPARGVHVVVPRALVDNDVAVILPVPGRRSTVFAVPWGEFTYVGTTDTDYDGNLDLPYCTADDTDYLLSSLGASTTRTLSLGDVVGTWAGLRPLLRGAGSNRTADLSRRHRVSRSPSGLITIAGGKLTTWRHMAQDTVDEVCDLLGQGARSRSKAVRLRGADGYDGVDDGDLGAGVTDHLVGRYGSEASVVLAMARQDPDLAQPLVPGLPYLRAEARFAVEHEMARTVDDVLARRTRARLLARDASADAAEAVAGVMASVLGWSAEEQAHQAATYRESVTAEREASQGRGPEPDLPEQPHGWVPGVRLPRALAPDR